MAYRANLLKTALIGYDDESNRLLIKPTVDGNMTVSKNNGGYKISARPFLTAVGLNDSLHGRYEAHINNDGDIIVELNKPLPEDEQSKKKKNKEIDNGVTTLKALREQAGLSVKEVAKKLNVTEMSVYRYEANKRHLDIEQVLELSSLYDCSTEEIIRAQLNSHQSDQ